jgi:hypothetical protein
LLLAKILSPAPALAPASLEGQPQGQQGPAEQQQQQQQQQQPAAFGMLPLQVGAAVWKVLCCCCNAQRFAQKPLYAPLLLPYRSLLGQLQCIRKGNAGCWMSLKRLCRSQQHLPTPGLLGRAGHE